MFFILLQFVKIVQYNLIMKKWILIYIFWILFSFHFSYSQSVDEVKKILDSIETASDSLRLVHYNTLTKYFFERDMEKSLKYAEQAKKLAIKLDDQVGLVNILRNYGNAHFYKQNFKQAKKLYLESYDVARKLGDHLLMGKALSNIAMVNTDLKLYNEAFEYSEKAEKEIKKTKNTSVLVSIYINRGVLNLELKKTSEAIRNYKSAYTLMDKSDLNSKGTIYNNLASLYIREANYAAGKDLLDSAMTIADKSKLKYLKLAAYGTYTELYDSLKDYKKSRDYFEKKYNMLDTLNMDASEQMLNELQVEHELDKKEEKIRLLEKVKELKDKKLNDEQDLRNSLILLLIVSGSLVVSTIFWVVFKHKTNNLLSDKNRLLKETNNRLKESESHLQQVNSTKDKFFSIIAHDLRNPFTAIFSISELLEKYYDKFTEESRRHKIKILYDSTNRTLKLVENLLEWSRSQRGVIDYNPRKFDLKEIAEGEIFILQNSADMKKIKIKNELPDEKFVYVDENMVKTIFRNLINNAIKFTDTGGEITICSECQKFNIEAGKGYLPVIINDTGVGIPEEARKDIFEIDKKYTRKGTNNEAGTGLGLILCKEFIELHKGQIGVESEPGKGSSFYFTLPEYCEK